MCNLNPFSGVSYGRFPRHLERSKANMICLGEKSPWLMAPNRRHSGQYNTINNRKFVEDHNLKFRALVSEPKVGQSPTLKISIAMKVPVVKEVNISK